jgi:hypothetical protein
MRAILERWRLESQNKTKGGNSEKSRFPTAEDFRRYTIDNWEMLGYASRADAERTVGVTAG